MKIFAGVDGGGTRTRLALAGEDGTLLGYASGGCCSFTDQGVEPAEKELIRLWREAWRTAGAEPRPADAIYMGMGSILSLQDAQINREIAAKIGLAEARNIFADNDVWNAHAGGLVGRPGILLIAGTGSACFGRNSLGENWRVGGWGHLLGETGSAYALGLAAMVAATREADGRGEQTSMTRFVRDALGLNDLKEIFRKVHYDGVSRAQVAALAPRIVALAEAGDIVAGRILQAQVEGLVEMVVTVAHRLGIKSPELALTGGLLMNAAGFRQIFLNHLTRKFAKFHLAEDGLAPVYGAVLLAFEQSVGVEPSAQFLQSLRSSSRHCSNLQ